MAPVHFFHTVEEEVYKRSKTLGGHGRLRFSSWTPSKSERRRERERERELY
jgi:hypothetical protein